MKKVEGFYLRFEGFPFHNPPSADDRLELLLLLLLPPLLFTLLLLFVLLLPVFPLVELLVLLALFGPGTIE
jgi:hypothetical protein